MVPPWAGTGPLRGHAHFLLPTAAPSFPPLALRMPVLRLPPPAVAGRWTPPGPESGLLSSTQKRTEEALTKQEALLRRAAAAEQGRPELSATRLAVSGVTVMGLVSGLSLANHLTRSPSCLRPLGSANADAGEEDCGRR